MARKQRNIKQWAGIVERWKLSGMSSKEFCMHEGFSEGRFYEVRKQLETGIEGQLRLFSPPAMTVYTLLS
jgi:hypothetical protein